MKERILRLNPGILGDGVVIDEFIKVVPKTPPVNAEIKGRGVLLSSQRGASPALGGMEALSLTDCPPMTPCFDPRKVCRVDS
jgi:hypothetical protein